MRAYNTCADGSFLISWHLLDAKKKQMLLRELSISGTHSIMIFYHKKSNFPWTWSVSIQNTTLRYKKSGSTNIHVKMLYYS